MYKIYVCVCKCDELCVYFSTKSNIGITKKSKIYMYISRIIYTHFDVHMKWNKIKMYNFMFKTIGNEKIA